MENCIVCNQVHDFEGKSLDEVNGDDKTLRLRLEKVLDEPVMGFGWICFSCQSDLVQIERLRNDFKQRYSDTAQWKQQWEPKVPGSSQLLDVTAFQSNSLPNLGDTVLFKPSNEIKSDTPWQDHNMGQASKTTFGRKQDQKLMGTECQGQGLEVKGETDSDDLDTGFDNEAESALETSKRLITEDNNSLRPLQKIFKKHCPKAKRSFVCLICNKVLNSSLSMYNHSKVHSDKELNPKGRSVPNVNDSFLKQDNRSSAVRRRSNRFAPKNVLTENLGTEQIDRVQTKQKSMPFKCSPCDQIFRGSFGLQQHMRWHAKQNDHAQQDAQQGAQQDEQQCSCSICGIIFPNKMSVRAHMVKHTVKDESKLSGDSDYEPNQEDNDSETEPNMEINYLEYESKSYPTRQKGEVKTQDLVCVEFRCTYCDQKFPRRLHLKKHIGKDHPEQVEGKFRCIYCDQKFFRPIHMQRHIRKEHPGQSPFLCTVCNKGFQRPSGLKVHMIKHSDERPHVCDQCGKTFKHNDHFKQHLRYHTGKTISCIVCSKLFINKSALNIHMRSHSVHTSNPPKIYPTNPKHPCWTCGKLISATRLKGHMLTHTGEKNYPCNVCNKAFYTRHGLTEHMKVHSSEKPFQCDQCGMSFRRSHELRYHNVTHSADRPFPCSKCGKAFKKKSSLQGHIKCMHMDIRPYSCTICNRTFKKSDQLKDHEYSHTAEPVFSCNLCEIKFRHKSTLHRHMVKHSENPEQIPRTRMISDTNAYSRARKQFLQTEVGKPLEQHDFPSLELPKASHDLQEMPIPGLAPQGISLHRAQSESTTPVASLESCSVPVQPSSSYVADEIEPNLMYRHYKQEIIQ